MNVSFYPPIAQPIIRKMRDGFLVTGCDGVCDFLTFWEGIAWRLFKKLPRRIAATPTGGEDA